METTDVIAVASLVSALVLLAALSLVFRACRYCHSRGYDLADAESEVAEYEWRALLYGLVDTIGAPPCGDSIADAAAEAREAVKGIKAEIEGLQLGIEQQQAVGAVYEAIVDWHEAHTQYTPEIPALSALKQALKVAKAEAGNP